MNKKKVIGYVGTRDLGRMREEDIRKLDVINIAFGHIRENETVWEDGAGTEESLERIRRIHPEIRIILSIGGWSADGFSQAAETQENRDIFVSSAMAIVEKWDFDGVDIDWEYPCSDQAGIAYGPQDKENFTFLMRDLRAGLTKTTEKTGKTYLLTCAVGGEQYFIDGTNMADVVPYLDYVNLMTYDLRGGFTKITGHHTGLYPQTGEPEGPSSARTVELFHNAGVPYEKMVLGSAFYGRRWHGVKDPGSMNGLGCEAETVGSFSGVRFPLQDPEMAKDYGFTRYWDDNAKAPYYFNGTDFISYDDEESLKLKCDFIKEKGLAGLMYWAYGNHVLFEVAAANLD